MNPPVKYKPFSPNDDYKHSIKMTDAVGERSFGVSRPQLGSTMVASAPTYVQEHSVSGGTTKAHKKLDGSLDISYDAETVFRAPFT
jgi:hypothetical protein